MGIQHGGGGAVMGGECGGGSDGRGVGMASVAVSGDSLLPRLL